MIAFLCGKIAGKTPQAVYVNVGGVGYEVLMGASSLAKLPETGSDIQIHTYLQVREDAMILFGFLTQEEKECFLKLIGVTGVGPKVALAALSFYSPQQLTEAILSQDVSRVSKIPGIGKKTAQRIILELKGSLDQNGTLFAPADDGGIGVAGSVSTQGVRAQATEALLSMGFTSAEAELALKGAAEGATEAQMIQYALKRLGSM